MVTVVNPNPHPSVVKEAICRKGCGATLSYVPNDVQNRYVRDYGGGGDTHYWINCPCGKQIAVKGY